MTRTRWTGLAGVLFGITFFIGVMLAGSTPDSSASDAVPKYADYWKSTSHQTHAMAASMILSYAFLLLLAFAAGLRHRLRTVDTGPLPALALAAGTAAAALLIGGGELGLSIGVTAHQSHSFNVDGNVAVLIDNIGYGMMAPGLMAAALMAVVVGLVTLRTKVLPVWTAWLGFLLGLTAVASFFSVWSAFIGFPLWSAVIGLVLLLRSEAPAPVAAESMASAAA